MMDYPNTTPLQVKEYIWYNYQNKYAFPWCSKNLDSACSEKSFDSLRLRANNFTLHCNYPECSKEGPMFQKMHSERKIRSK